MFDCTVHPRAESVTFELCCLELSMDFSLSRSPWGPLDFAQVMCLTQVVLSGKICQLIALPICAKGEGTQVDLI